MRLLAQGVFCRLAYIFQINDRNFSAVLCVGVDQILILAVGTHELIRRTFATRSLHDGYPSALHLQSFVELTFCLCERNAYAHVLTFLVVAQIFGGVHTHYHTARATNLNLDGVGIEENVVVLIDEREVCVRAVLTHTDRLHIVVAYTL